MPRSILYTETARQGTDKINEIFGIESGALADPWALTFNVQKRIRTLTVNSNITLTVAASGKISETEEILVTTGNGVNTLTMPTGAIMLGDIFNFDKIQRIHFLYDGTYVIGVITTLADVPVAPILSAAVIQDATDARLDLTFDVAVNITTAGWTVTASGGAVTVDAVASGSGTTTPKFTLSRAILGTETVTVSYNVGTGNTVATSGGVELAAITDQAVTNNVITTLLFVPFTGTTIDTGAGTVTNPDVADLTISQNGKLLFTRTTDNAVASSITNYWRSTNTYGRGSYAVLINRDTGYLFSIFSFMYRVDANNDITILQKDNDEITIRIRSAGAVVYTLDILISVNARFKITFNAAHEIRFWRWNGTAWIQQGTTQTFNIGAAGNIQMGSASATADAPADVLSFDDVYVTDKDYTTVTP